MIYQDKQYMQFQAWADKAELITAGGMPLLFKNGTAYTPNNSYGGPLNSGFSYAQFISDLTKAGATNYIIRFSPWQMNHRYFPEDKMEFSRHTVVRDLWEPIKFGHGTRSSITKNIAMGCYCDIAPGVNTTYQNMLEFQGLYIATMERNQAEDCYKYDINYFVRMFAMLMDNLDLFMIRNSDGKPIAAATFLHDRYTAHYQFSGMDITYAHLYPMERLISEACHYYRDKNKILLHFGGGLAEDDSLHRFKKKFGNKELEYFVARGSV